MTQEALIDRYVEPAKTLVFNPDFVRRVHAKRRMEEEKAAIADRARKEGERQERWLAAVEERKRKAVEYAEAMKEAPPSPRSIIVLTEIGHGLPEGSITGTSRKVPVVKARFEAIAKVREARPDLSLPALGRIFRRDHTTILYALRKVGASR